MKLTETKDHLCHFSPLKPLYRTTKIHPSRASLVTQIAAPGGSVWFSSNTYGRPRHDLWDCHICRPIGMVNVGIYGLRRSMSGNLDQKGPCPLDLVQDLAQALSSHL